MSDDSSLSALLYAERDIRALDRNGNHYCKHASAMTGEKLHSKSAIAAELAHRDFLIQEGMACMVALKQYADDFGDDIDPKVVKAEAGEALLRMQGKYGV